MKLLIVDDEESITTFLSRSLKNSLHEVRTANSGTEALTLMQEHPPDILITDIRMPNMDGVELTKETLSIYPDVVIIAITGYSDLETAVEIMKYGAMDFLQKPVKIADMQMAIKSASDRWRLRRELRLANESLQQTNTELFCEIAEHKKTEEKLKESEEMARALLNATTDAVSLLDKKGCFLTVNKVSAEYLNKKTDELLGVCCFDLFPPDVAKRRREMVEKVIQTGKPIRFTDERDGNFFDNSLYPVLNINGNVENIAVYSRNITEQKQAKDALESSQIRLETIFQSIPEGIVTLDHDMRIIQKNKPLDNICSVFHQTEIGSIVIKPSERCHAECFNILKHTLMTHQPVKEYHLDCNFNKESVRNLILTSSPLLNPSNNKFEGAILVIRDITRLTELESKLQPVVFFENIIGVSQKMQRIYTLIQQVANLETTVLITGESGTGKELVMEAIHARGMRSSGPLVRVNCSALPETLLESELFGHIKGSFSGAVSDRIGRFQAADHGTIFLDEIGDISPHVQLKLLRFLERKEFERVGDSRTCKTDVRIIAATNVNLKEKVRQGNFREDFYYRLGVMTIHIPPLRERKEDIPVLADHFCHIFSKRFNKVFKGISDDSLDIFMQYSWHGNIRELKYVMERACILCPGNSITPEYLPSELMLNAKSFFSSHTLHPSSSQSHDLKQAQTEHTLSREKILGILEKTDGNKAKSARLLGISRSTLYRKILEFDIE